MSKIDIGSADLGVSGRLAQQAGMREDGWQHALEQAFIAQSGRHAGAGDAGLSADKPPVPKREAVSDPGGLPPDIEGMRTRRSPTAAGMAEASAPAVVMAVRPEGDSVQVARPATASDGTDARDADGAPSMDNTAPLVHLAWSAYARSSTVSGIPGPMPGVEAPAAAPAVAAGSEVSRQHVFLERTQQGAVIWVRDLQATPAQLRQLVSALRQQSLSSGVPVCGVRINGTPVDPDTIAESAALFAPEAPAPNGPPVLSRRSTHGH